MLANEVASRRLDTYQRAVGLGLLVARTLDIANEHRSAQRVGPS